MSTSLVNIFIIFMLISEVRSYEFLCSEAEKQEMRVCVNNTLSMVQHMITTCHDKNRCTDQDFSLDLSKMPIADEHLLSMLNKTMHCRKDILSDYVLNDTNSCLHGQNLNYSLTADEVETYETLGSFMVGTVIKFPAFKSSECTTAGKCVKKQISTVRKFYADCARNFSMTSKCMWNQTVQLFCNCFDESDDKNGELYGSKFVECLGSGNEKFAKSILNLYEKYRSSKKINGWCQTFESALKSDEDQTASVEEMMRNSKISENDVKFLGSKMADVWGKISMRKYDN